MFPEELGIKFKEYVDSIKTERYDLEDKRKIISELRIILEKSLTSPSSTSTCLCQELKLSFSKRIVYCPGKSPLIVYESPKKEVMKSLQ